jgi:hypothetical protein
VAGEQIGKTSALENTESGRGDRLNGVLDPAQNRRSDPDRIAGEHDIEDLTRTVREVVVADRPSFEQCVHRPPHLILADDVGARRDNDVVRLHLGDEAEFRFRERPEESPSSERTLLARHEHRRGLPSQTGGVHILLTGRGAAKFRRKIKEISNVTRQLRKAITARSNHVNPHHMF